MNTTTISDLLVRTCPPLFLSFQTNQQSKDRTGGETQLERELDALSERLLRRIGVRSDHGHDSVRAQDGPDGRNGRVGEASGPVVRARRHRPSRLVEEHHEPRRQRKQRNERERYQRHAPAAILSKEYQACMFA
jgi:hypothetical protein